MRNDEKYFELGQKQVLPAFLTRVLEMAMKVTSYLNCAWVFKWTQRFFKDVSDEIKAL